VRNLWGGAARGWWERSGHSEHKIIYGKKKEGAFLVARYGGGGERSRRGREVRGPKRSRGGGPCNSTRGRKKPFHPGREIDSGLHVIKNMAFTLGRGSPAALTNSDEAGRNRLSRARGGNASRIEGGKEFGVRSTAKGGRKNSSHVPGTSATGPQKASNPSSERPREEGEGGAGSSPIPPSKELAHLGGKESEPGERKDGRGLALAGSQQTRKKGWFAGAGEVTVRGRSQSGRVEGKKLPTRLETSARSKSTGNQKLARGSSRLPQKGERLRAKR